MRHEVQVRLIKQLEARLDAGTNVDAGGLMLNPTRVTSTPNWPSESGTSSSFPTHRA